MEHQARRTAPTRGVIAAYGALVVVIGAVWANSVSGGPIFDDHFLAEWRRRWPHAVVHRFEDCGHYILEDAADEVVARVRDFIGTHPVPTGA